MATAINESMGDRVDEKCSIPHPYPCAQITVTDTGRGISPNFLPYVFDDFRQADSSTNRKFGGLGLGFAIVYHLIVDAHGRTVQAEGLGEGQGATFTVKLPLLTASLQLIREDLTYG
jgi:signal transduction histidine kinase